MKKTIYEKMKDINAEMDHHESDLYVKVSPETTKILKTTNYSYTLFVSQKDYQLWYEIPFMYDPFWEKKGM